MFFFFPKSIALMSQKARSLVSILDISSSLSMQLISIYSGVFIFLRPYFWTTSGFSLPSLKNLPVRSTWRIDYFRGNNFSSEWTFNGSQKSNLCDMILLASISTNLSRISTDLDVGTKDFGLVTALRMDALMLYSVFPLIWNSSTLTTEKSNIDRSIFFPLNIMSDCLLDWTNTLFLAICTIAAYWFKILFF